MIDVRDVHDHWSLSVSGRVIAALRSTVSWPTSKQSQTNYHHHNQLSSMIKHPQQLDILEVPQTNYHLTTKL